MSEDFDIPDFDEEALDDQPQTEPGDGMSLDELTAMLEHDPDFSSEALADRNGQTSLNPQLTINWRTIDDDDRPDACRTLASWVNEWLIPRYNVKVKLIPDCWFQHTDLVEELSALHSAWLVAFDPADAGWGPIGWHERYAQAQTRTAFHERCAGGAHRPDPTRSMPTVPDTF